MKKFSESIIVEDYIIQKLTEKGWKFVPAESLEREAYDEPLMIPPLVRALEEINANKGITQEEISKVVNELKLTGTGIEGAKRILNFYKFGVPVKFEKERIVRYVRIFDFDEIENNAFVVSRQVYYYGRKNIRTDIILYINGIPLVNIECKNPVSMSENWYNAYRQIKDYERIVPELYKYVQIGIAAESVAKYFPIVPWQDEAKIDEWKEEGKDSSDAMIEMLSRESLLDIIENFLFSRTEMGEASKVIARYMQYRAANRMVKRVLGNLKGENEKNRGLIWHWQGSGKTLTMIFAANKLYYSKSLENPSVFFIVDRIELEDQLYKEIFALDMVAPEIIGSVRDLQDILKYDDYRGKRGVFITLLHKFRPEELRGLQKELESISAWKETVMSRKNVIAFIDEGHRTQYGTLAAQMKALLKNAFFFALTGTPIAKRGRDTYLEFSFPPDEIYLDRYFITDSIKDNFTVKIIYQPRLEKEVHLKKKMLDAFLETELEELPEEIRDDIEERIKKRLNAIKIFLENPQRIGVIAKDIADHFQENVDGKFKAMVVAGSRKACELYCMELNKHLPAKYSEVVMTLGREEDPILELSVAEARVRYGGKNITDIRKDVVEKFKEEEFPKILIVTDMLLTGFDAPLLQVMYLDKPLREHRLLQAVARTNRPYKDIKEGGLVIDYIGILKEFKKALEIYSEDDIKGAIFTIENIREEFALVIKYLIGLLKDVPEDYKRDSLLKAIEILTEDEQKEKEFTDGYLKLRKLFELLGPDEFKLEYFKAFKWISAIYTYYIKMVVRKPIYEGQAQRYYDKTVKYIHKATEIEKLDNDLPFIELDRHYLEKLEERVKNKKEKAANILFALNRMVLVDRHRNPVYESLVEKVERLLDLWKEKTKDYKKICIQGSMLFQDINNLSERQRALGFSDLEYALLLELEKGLNGLNGLEADVKELSDELSSRLFRGWLNQATVKKEVEREIRRFVRGMKGKYDLSLDEMNQLHERLVESVKNYGS